MKAFMFTLAAVLVGIWAWSKLSKPAAVTGAKASNPADSTAPFQGPEIDPVTGSYLPPDAQPGSVSFPQDGMNGGYAGGSSGSKL